MARAALTAERLRELLNYDQLTGVFTWRVRTHGKGGVIEPGSVAGFLTDTRGYMAIGLDGTKYLLHRVAWLYVYGVWPDRGLDHKDSIKSHNWIDNLRLATQGENNQNKSKAHRNNSSGLLGVAKGRPGSWKAQIGHDGKQIYLGSYDTPAEAHDAYLSSKAQIHPFRPMP